MVLFTVWFHLSIANIACDVFYRRFIVPVGSSGEKVPGRGVSWDE